MSDPQQNNYDDSSLRYVSVMVNPVVRNTVRGIAKKWNPLSPLSKKIKDFYVSMPRSSHAPTDMELEMFLGAEGFDNSAIGLAVMLKNQFENAINENGVDTFIESFLKKCRRDMVGEISRTFNEERDRIGEGIATSNLINSMSDLKKMTAKRVDVINFTEIDMEKFYAEEIDTPKRLIKSQFNLIKELSDNGAYEKGWLVQVVAPTSSGKQAPLDTQVLAEGGFKRFGDLKVGDKIFSQDGTLTTVTGIFPQGVKPCYRVTTVDGQNTRCGIEHLWRVKRRDHRGWKWDTIELKEILEKGLKCGSEYKWHLPVNKAIQFSEKVLPIHPYVLGILLSEGCLTLSGVVFSNPEDDIMARIQGFLGKDYVVKRNPNEKCRKRIVPMEDHGRNPLVTSLRSMGLCDKLSGEKFIPFDYLHGSIEQRKLLLAGLFDGDGHIPAKSKSLSYSTTSDRLATDVVYLCRSLGYGARIKKTDRTKENKGINYRISILTSEKIFMSEKHNRRWNAVAEKGNRSYSYESVSISSVEQLEDCEMQCIMVDHPSHLYICDDYIVTHNTLWLLNEAIHFADSGLRVFWLALGDMLKRDLLERALCITTQTDRTEVRPKFKELWKDPYVQKVLANIDFVVERSKRLTASDISNITLSHEVGRDPYDVVIVDYDDNMKREQGENGQGGGSMYEDGGNAYAELVNLAQGGEKTSDSTYRLVFVAAQAKPGSWGKEELPLDSVACSSQKAMKANLTISLNRNAVARNVGTMSIVKHRHGKEGSTKYVREEYGVFRGIDKREYENLVNRSVYDNNMASTTESPIVMPVMSVVEEE